MGRDGNLAFSNYVWINIGGASANLETLMQTLVFGKN